MDKLEELEVLLELLRKNGVSSYSDGSMSIQLTVDPYADDEEETYETKGLKEIPYKTN